MARRDGIVLVTGGAGFIGSHIAIRLAALGRRVRILDNLSTGRRENLEIVRAEAKGLVDIQVGDIRDPDHVRRGMDGVVEVVHQAALASVERSMRNPWESHEVNVDGTIRLLEAARAGSVRRFLLAGSSSVYGDQADLPKHEGMAPAPRSPYAMSKLVAEQYTRLYAEAFGVPTLTLRYFNVFGPRQDPASPYAAVIPLFLKALLKGEPPTIHGDGRQTRDFTYITNVVDANVAALAAPSAAGEAMNIACGLRLSLLDLLGMLQEATGVTVAPRFGPPRPGDVRDSQADISRARSLIGFEPRVSVVEGIRSTVESFRSA